MGLIDREALKNYIDEMPEVSVEEISAKAIDEFAERLKSDEFQKYNLDMVFETSRDLSYSHCINAFCEYIDEVAKMLKGGAVWENLNIMY